VGRCQMLTVDLVFGTLSRRRRNQVDPFRFTILLIVVASVGRVRQQAFRKEFKFLQILCVIINLYHEGDPERREFTIADPEGYAQQHRLELLGELIGMVERWKSAGMRQAKVHSRFNKRGWGNIVGGILEACGEPDFLANADEAATLLDETRREFGELVEVLANHSQGNWTASELVDLCRRVGLMNADPGDGSSRSLSTKMGTLAGRYVGSRFTLADGREATFLRTHHRSQRKHLQSRLRSEKCRTLSDLPNLCRTFNGNYTYAGARTHAHMCGFCSQGNRFGRFGRFGTSESESHLLQDSVYRNKYGFRAYRSGGSLWWKLK
ncbi:MAG: hypothetical protein JWM11_4524, partial [Planctomycetaceae bacterium]|nr:hypothetical protein [Planctomycetaceae bacterium]